MKAFASLNGLALLLAVACGSTNPPCGATGQEQFVPLTSDPVWNSLKQAEQELGKENASLPAGQRLQDCHDHWQTVVEEHVCHEATLHLCGKLCKTDDERRSCQENQGHARLMQQCREQAVGTFTGIYSSCKGFHLCGEILQPPETACPK